MRWKQFAALIALTGTASATPGAQDKRDLPRLVVALNAAEPISVEKLQAILGINLTCDSAYHCSGGPLPLVGMRVGKVDFRHNDSGSILMLENLEGACVKAESVEVGVDFYPAMNACTDGGICRYRTAKRDWGNLHLRMPDDPDAPQCTQEVVLNEEH